MFKSNQIKEILNEKNPTDQLGRHALMTVKYVTAIGFPTMIFIQLSILCYFDFRNGWKEPQDCSVTTSGFGRRLK